MGNRESAKTVRDRGRAYRETVKIRALSYLGNKCASCGYDRCMDAFDFHHVNPKSKEFAINEGFCRHFAWERIKNELDKCVLLCANCHRELHYKEK